MLDETTFNFSLALYSNFSTIVFFSIAIKTKKLLNWSATLGIFAIGSIFIYLQEFDEGYRTIGNVFYALSAILLLIIVTYEYYHLLSKNEIKKKFYFVLFFIISCFLFILLPFGSFFIRIQLALLFLLLMSIALFYAVYSIKKTPSYLLMLLTLLSSAFTLIMTLLSGIELNPFWELSYLGNIVFITFILTIPIVRYLEDKLIMTRERYQLLYEITRVGLLTSSSDGSILAANPAAASILGYEDIEELKTVNAKTLYTNPEERSILLKRLEEDSYFDNYELKLLRKDGTHIYALTSASLQPILENDESFIEWVFRDISHMREAELARKELETRRKRFIETTSHELRTPLTNIKGFVDILEREGKNISDDRREKSFQYIDSGITRLNRLITDVGDISKIEKEDFLIDKKPINICQFLNELMDHYKMLLGNEIQFNKCLETEIVFSIDSDRIQQVIENIITNSIRNSLKGDVKIVMNVKFSNSIMEIDITDNGAGIELANLEKIFEPFVSFKTEYSARGAGIGLFLSRTIIEKHGGSITAHSEGLGHGTTVNIKLPY